MLSLRTTLLAAIAYVLVLAIVVLEVPLVLNLSRRVDAEVKAIDGQPVENPDTFTGGPIVVNRPAAGQDAGDEQSKA